MVNNKNMTAIEWLIGMISYTSKDTFHAMKESGFLQQAKQMEKEQMFEFANKVLDNTVGDYDGDIELLTPLDDIFNQTMTNEENNDKLWEYEDFVAQFPPNKTYEYVMVPKEKRSKDKEYIYK